MSLAFLYPGQGAQKVGMAADIYESSDLAKERFAKASEILGYDLTKIIFEGPEEELTKTQNTQPALFVVEAIITDLLKEKGLTPTVTMGHSLGEYSALYGAEVVSFEDGVKLVAKRGELMAKAGSESEGGMAAIIGMDKEVIKENLTEITNGVVVTANENAPDQTVISGDKVAVLAACDLLKEAGAKRAIPLAVSGAFHSPLMQSAADEFEPFLAAIPFQDAVCPVITNVTAKEERDGAMLKSLLIEQLLSPVRWVDAQKSLLALAPELIYEVGPGTVLKGLARKFDRALKVKGCDTIVAIEKVTE